MTITRIFSPLAFFMIATLYGQEFPRVNQERLEANILKLATYGIEADGRVNRVAFSDADIAGRAYTLQLMRDAGLEVSVDFAGNLIGKRAGTDKNAKPIAFGSHIDMVPYGGNYDGCVGSLAAIEVVRTLNENAIRTRHPLEVIVFSNEEGGVMGSRAIAGHLGQGALAVRNSTGYTMAEGIQRIGGDTTRLKEVQRPPGSLAAFLELHIEQGANLEESDTDIGIVQGIVGLTWWEIEITGFANHAGTTPMNRRQDALVAAAQLISAVNRIAKTTEGTHVATVGRIRAEPGAPNVIPGKVIMSLEIRDLKEEKISSLFRAIEMEAGKIAGATETDIAIRPLDTTGKPAMMDSEFQKVIETSCRDLSLSFKYMPSGAGHDAQDIALISPAGMIFVPSKGGISHSPDEFTSPEDMANGADVLLHSLLHLDQKLK